MVGFKVKYYSEDTIAIEKDDYIIAKIEFYFDDDTNSYHNYKNGETVTMYCSCSNYDLTDEYDIYIGVSQKEYTFSNLGEYVTFVKAFIPEHYWPDVFFNNANRIYKLGLH